jgi:hypothetical protein
LKSFQDYLLKKCQVLAKSNLVLPAKTRLNQELILRRLVVLELVLE